MFSSSMFMSRISYVQRLNQYSRMSEKNMFHGSIATNLTSGWKQLGKKCCVFRIVAVAAGNNEMPILGSPNISSIFGIARFVVGVVFL